MNHRCAELDPDLAEIAGNMTAAQRLIFAEQLKDWSQQLIQLTGQIDNALSIPAEPVKAPKGFVQINLATGQQRKLRNLANQCGVALRDVSRWALTIMQERLEKDAKVARAFGCTAFEFERRCLKPERN